MSKELASSSKTNHMVYGGGSTDSETFWLSFRDEDGCILEDTAFKVFLFCDYFTSLKHRRSSIIGSATREFEMKINSLGADKVWDYENGFHWFSKTNRIKKFLAHYKLYESILSIPGDVVELGVFKGNSLIRFATYRDILERESERRVIGFDAFGEFPRERLSNGDDLEFIEKFEGESGVGLTKEELTTIFTQKQIHNVFLVEERIVHCQIITMDPMKATSRYCTSI